MKKIIFLFLLFITLFSCTNNEIIDSNLDERIQGSWLIKNDYRYIEFKNNHFYINHILGIPLYKGYYNLNFLDNTVNLFWNDTINNKYGYFYYIKNIQNDKCETIILKDMPYSFNVIDTLYRVELIYNYDFQY